MWFRKLKVCNVGPFADLSLDLTRGSVGVFGKNGAGKSTFLSLLYGLVTNDYSRFEGVKADLVRNTAGKDEPAYVSGEVEHGGKVLTITRNFRPTKSDPNTTLVVDGGKPITNSDKADEEIARTLGVDGKLLDLYVFKEQDKVYDFLTTTPANRAKAYQVLCRTEKCEKLWSLLGDFLNKDKEITQEVVDNSDELTQAVTDLESQLVALGERQQQARDKLCTDKWVTIYEEHVRAHYRLEQLRQDEAKAKVLLNQARKQADTAAAEVESAKICAEDMITKVNKRRSKADDTRAALKAVEAYSAYRKRRRQLKDEAEALALELENNPPPEYPADADVVDELRQLLTQARQDLKTAQKVTTAFQETGRTACPTCQTPVDHLKDYLAAQQAAAKELPGTVAKLEARVTAVEDYKAAARKYEKWKAGYEARLAANQAARDALKQIEAPDGDEAELKAWLEKFTALEAEAKAAAVDLAAATAAADKAAADLAARRTRVAEIKQEIEESTVSPEKVEKAKRRLAEHAEAQSEVARVEGEAAGLTKLKEAKEEDLKKLKARLKRTRKVRQMAAVVSAVRDVLHRDRLPNRVAATNLARMEGDVNEHLGRFGDPFWVEANKELSFTVHKPGEPPQPAGRLSTGQRVVLALAFWPAVASLWATDLGILCLDEPTANLDADNRKFLAQALGAMTAEVRGRRQVIMVTHDPDLRPAFDQVVEL